MEWALAPGVGFDQVGSYRLVIDCIMWYCVFQWVGTSLLLPEVHSLFFLSQQFWERGGCRDGRFTREATCVLFRVVGSV